VNAPLLVLFIGKGGLQLDSLKGAYFDERREELKKLFERNVLAWKEQEGRWFPVDNDPCFIVISPLGEIHAAAKECCVEVVTKFGAPIQVKTTEKSNGSARFGYEFLPPVGVEGVA
jgi:hypothetical protein